MSHCASLSTAIALASLALASCTTPTRSFEGPSALGRVANCPSLGPSSYRVTGAELRAAHVPNLLEAVERVRPRFLRSHAPRRDQAPVVYADGTRVGPVHRLRDISVMDVVDVVFVAAPDATTRFGTDHAGGALLVRTQTSVGMGRCPGA